MSKNKKGKVVQLQSNQLSPEKYIKTHARSLPVAECWISEGWQSHGICNIIIARRHKTGNITAGVYLADLYCLGLKNTTYHFNLDPDDYEYLKGNCGDLEKCDYVLVHNIIYGAIEFADDFGFRPHKDFDIAQFILEEDDESVELMDIEFGYEGQPFYMQGPHDSQAKINQIKATLLRTAGEGNFDMEGLDDDEFDEDFDEDDDFDDEDLQTEQEEMLEDILRKLKLIDKVYGKVFRTDEVKQMIKASPIGKGYRLSKKPIKTPESEFDSPEQEALYADLLALFQNSDFAPAIKGLKKAITKYPARPPFYNLLQACYIFDEQFDKSKELTVEMYKRFPDYLFATVPYANMLIDEERYAEVFKVFHGQSDLNYLYPERKLFNALEAAIYYAVMCRYYTAIDNIDFAEMYVNAIFKKDIAHPPHQTMVNTALSEFCYAKTIKVKDKLGL